MKREKTCLIIHNDIKKILEVAFVLLICRFRS